MIKSLLSSFRLKRFRALLHGQNFKLKLDGGVETLSFYTTRYIDAQNSDQAAEKAKVMVLNELNHRLNAPDDPPSLMVEEIPQVKWRASRFRKQGGFTFYDDSEEAKAATDKDTST